MALLQLHAHISLSSNEWICLEKMAETEASNRWAYVHVLRHQLVVVILELQKWNKIVILIHKIVFMLVQWVWSMRKDASDRNQRNKTSWNLLSYQTINSALKRLCSFLSHPPLPHWHHDYTKIKWCIVCGKTLNNPRLLYKWLTTEYHSVPRTHPLILSNQQHNLFHSTNGWHLGQHREQASNISVFPQ